MSWILVGVAGCTIDSDATLDFTNQTDETVWVGFNGFAPDGFKIPESLWTEAGPGERVAKQPMNRVPEAVARNHPSWSLAGSVSTLDGCVRRWSMSSLRFAVARQMLESAAP